MEPLVQDHVPALTRHRLSWVKQNYLRAETLIRANARLVDYQSTLPLANLWGGGDVASADGLRFVTPSKTIHAGPNPKYFPKGGRGITWYNFMSDQFSGFHGIVIPGTLRDSIYVLEGLLEHQARAEHHWDDMLCIAGSLKLGTIQASELIRSLLKSERPSSLALAIMEAGRINKTIYLLNYVNDESYRRRILTQLNRTEKRHDLARVICHGRRGEIRKRYREGQEDQLGALGLVTNAVVLWNTIYMQDALNHLKQTGLPILDNDIAGLWPLRHEHLNVLGHYSFSLSETILAGKHRPLNQLETTFSEDLELILGALDTKSDV
jgi:TnpA family transposase